MIEEPGSTGRGWELPIVIVLGWVAVVWLGWHEGNIVAAVVTLAFTVLVTGMFVAGRRRK